MISTTTSHIALSMPQKRRHAELESDTNDFESDTADFESDTDELNDCDSYIESAHLRTLSSSLPRAELTTENLQLHTLLEGTDEPVNMAGGTSAPSTAVDYNDKSSLAKYGVVFDSHEEPPSELLRHLRDQVEVQRSLESPSAKHLHDIQPVAEGVSESRSIEMICKYIMFPDRLDNPTGEADVYLAHETRFDRRYVQHPDGSGLKEARPDRVNAYLSSQITRGLIKVPFTTAEERILSEGNIHPDMFAPWLTGQFKTALIGLLVAALQAARDGVAVQNYLLALFRRAGVKPTVVDTLHWSVVCNTQTVELFCHWYDDVNNQYHMFKLCQAGLRASFRDLDRNKDMVQMRMYLRNILEWAQNQRLDRIREVVATIQQNGQIDAIKLAKAEAQIQAKARANAQAAAMKRGNKAPSRRTHTTGSRSLTFAVPSSPPSDKGYGGSRQHETSPRNTTGRTSGSSSKRQRSQSGPQNEDLEDELAPRRR